MRDRREVSVSILATTADRVLTVLSLFSGDKWVWTVEEAAQALGLPTSTTYRYFKSLADCELIGPHQTGNYVLGPAVYELDRALRTHDPFVNAASGEMLRLAAENDRTIILLTRLYKNKVMCVHREGESFAAQGYERGRPMPLERGAASKVILANLPLRQLRTLAEDIEADGGPSIGDLRNELRTIRANGYAITYGEIDPGKVGISVPVFRENEVLEGSLSFVLEDGEHSSLAHYVDQLNRSRKIVESNLHERVNAKD